MREQVEMLKHHTDFGAHHVDVFHVLMELNTIDVDAAGIMCFEPVDTANQGRLSGARGPAYDDAFAYSDVQVNVCKGLKIAEELAHSFN